MFDVLEVSFGGDSFWYIISLDPPSGAKLMMIKDATTQPLSKPLGEDWHALLTLFLLEGCFDMDWRCEKMKYIGSTFLPESCK